MDPLDRAGLDVDQPDPRVVPGAFRRFVGADRRDLASRPAELEHVHALGLHLARFARLGVHEVEPAPERGGPDDLRVRLLRSGLADLRRALRTRPVGSEVGREHEQRRPVGRPLDVLDRAGDLAQLSAAVNPEAHPTGVAAVRRERERPVGRVARQRVGRPLVGDRRIVDPEARLHRLGLLAEDRRDDVRNLRAVRREG